MTVQPASLLLSLKSHKLSAAEYKVVLHCVHTQLDVRQSPIVIHQQFQDHYPQLQQLYQELFPTASSRWVAQHCWTEKCYYRLSFKNVLKGLGGGQTKVL